MEDGRLLEMYDNVKHTNPAMQKQLYNRNTFSEKSQFLFLATGQ